MQRPFNMLKTFVRNDKRREDQRERARKLRETTIKRERNEQQVAMRQDVTRLFMVLKLVRLCIPLHILCKLLICRRLSSSR
ncbi:PRRP3 [Hyposoter didymator ichnovirus]|nr:PRRP3 [Hyposoter didymator ichnovirus]